MALPDLAGGACYLNLLQNMDKDLLDKYLRNVCTEDELNKVVEWLSQPAGTFDDMDLFQHVWDELPEETDIIAQNRRERILDAIHHRINLKKPEGLAARIKSEDVRLSRRRHIIRVISRAAAVIFIPVFLFGLYTSARFLSAGRESGTTTEVFYEVSSSADAITKVDLADGTIVWLNHKSTLRYPARFKGRTRNVKLSGEGYFDVSHNPDVPFVVSAGPINIIARGTEFNVCAYPDDDKTEATLVEGEIEIDKPGDRSPGPKSITLKPSERIIYDSSCRTMTSQMTVDDRYYAWKSGRLVFKNEPMEEVVKKLSRWFNVDIEIRDSGLNDLTYTATFVDETLPQVMDLLAIATPIDYSIRNSEKSDDETYSKRKVILTSRKRMPGR
jgi:ferric-dicitrate binding protein FerR (iron transport regulator)